MSTTGDGPHPEGETVTLTMDQLWRLAAGESVRLEDADAAAVEVVPPDPFDDATPSIDP